MFSEALIHGLIDWDDFLAIAKNSGAIQPGRDDSPHTSRSGVAAGQTIFISKNGFSSRKEPNQIPSQVTHLYGAAGIVEQSNAFSLSPQKLLALCQSDRPHPVPYHRIFEAMLYDGVTQNAAHIRNVAQQVLGEDRLLQIEKDFANREARFSRDRTPPFLNPLLALHTESRILRKNLGEVSTLEVALDALDANPKAQIWVTNHDSDLYPIHGRIELDPTIVRQHAGLHDPVRGMNASATSDDARMRLHFVTTARMLDSVHAVNGAPANSLPTEYASVKARPNIAKHHDHSWQARLKQTFETAERYRD